MTFELPPTGPMEVQSFVSVSHRPHTIGRVQDGYLTADRYRGARLALAGVIIVATAAMIVGAGTQHQIVMVASTPFIFFAGMVGVLLRNRDDATRVSVDACENGLRVTTGTRRYQRRQEEIFWLDITRLEVGESESPDGELLAARLSHGTDRATGLPARLIGVPDLVTRIEREMADVAAARAKEKREREEARAAEGAAMAGDVP